MIGRADDVAQILAAKCAHARTVEPYSLRRSHQGNLLVFVVNDRGQTRCYRADRIRAVSIEPESFTPRYLVEF